MPNLRKPFITIAASLASLTVGFVPLQLGIKPAQADQLNDRIVDLMNARNIRGVSLAIIQDGSITTRVYGFTDNTKKVRVTPKTIFQAGSLSKPVSALGLLLLVQNRVYEEYYCQFRFIGQCIRGVVTKRYSLDENINKYLKTWQVPENQYTSGSKVTLRTILSHTGGLTVQGFSGYKSGANIPSLLSILNGTSPANSLPIRVNFTPSSQYRYSGGGYVVMQQMIEDATGTSFSTFMKDTVLKPLGMENSSFINRPLLGMMAASAATGHKNGTPVIGKWHTYPEMAAAGLWTTPSDLARFLIAVRDSYIGAPNSLLSKDMAQKMLTKQYSVSNYGLGVSLAGSSRSFQFSHSGRNEGFDSLMVMHPHAGLGVVIMINTNDDSGTLNQIYNEVRKFYYYKWYDTLKL